MRLILLTVAIVLMSSPAQAAGPVGETNRTISLASAAARRTDHKSELNITIWYPAVADAKVSMVLIGPPGNVLFEGAPVAQDAKAISGKRPVILLSHGFGGTAEDMVWLGEGLASGGFIVIAVDHPGNNALDKTLVGATAWWERPRDMIAALDAMRQDPQFGALIDDSKVGAAGFSMGGVTALALAGARIDPVHFDEYCRSSPTDGVCQPPPEMPGIPRMSLQAGLKLLGLTDAAAHAGDRTALASVRAVLSIAPPSQQLRPASLANIKVPVVLMVGSADRMVPVAHQAGIAAREIKGARLIVLPGVAHYSFIATCREAGRAAIEACREAPKQDEAHRAAIATGLELFNATLGKPH